MYQDPSFNGYSSGRSRDQTNTKLPINPPLESRRSPAYLTKLRPGRACGGVHRPSTPASLANEYLIYRRLGAGIDGDGPLQIAK